MLKAMEAGMLEGVQGTGASEVWGASRRGQGFRLGLPGSRPRTASQLRFLGKGRAG